MKESRIMANSSVRWWDAPSPRKVIGWYVALCIVIMLMLGYPSIFFAEGILLLPVMGLAIFSWRAQGVDTVAAPDSTSLAKGDAGAEKPRSAGKWDQQFSGAIAIVLWVIIASVTLAYSFSLVSPGSVNVRSSGIALPALPASAEAATSILLATAALSLFLLTPTGRKAAARVTPINPYVFRHSVGLSLATIFVLSSITPLLVSRGVPSAVSTLYLPSDPSQATGAQAAGMVYELLCFVPLAFSAAGWPHFRNFRDTCARLGLGGPGIRKVAVGVVAGLIMAGVAAFMLDPAVRWLWNLGGWPHSDPALPVRLFSWAMNPWGALLVSISAGAGEELLVRGLLQPRLGLILSNLAFTAMHAYGYGWDALLSVFVLGLALGALRTRTGTATAMLAHGLYDFCTLIGISLLR